MIFKIKYMANIIEFITEQNKKKENTKDNGAVQSVGKQQIKKGNVMIIVKSKITGKFLRRHSGSYRNLNYDMLHKLFKNDEGKTSSEQRKKDVHEEMFNAIPFNARMYMHVSGAVFSVGKRLSYVVPEMGRDNVCQLPEHLELYRITKSNLTITKVETGNG